MAASLQELRAQLQELEEAQHLDNVAIWVTVQQIVSLLNHEAMAEMRKAASAPLPDPEDETTSQSGKGQSRALDLLLEADELVERLVNDQDMENEEGVNRLQSITFNSLACYWKRYVNILVLLFLTLSTSPQYPLPSILVFFIFFNR